MRNNSKSKKKHIKDIKRKKNNTRKSHKTHTKKRKFRNRKNKRGGAEEDQEDCPICFEPMSSENEITTSCGHKFHKDCILQTCKIQYWNKNINECLCPLCRKDIDEEIKQLLPPAPVPDFDPKHLTMETFPLYINYELSHLPEENPDSALYNLLYSFVGLDDLPIDVHDPLIDREGVETPNIMEFTKMHVANRFSDRNPLYVYYFNGFVNAVPQRIEPNKKYYAFVLDEDGITELEGFY